MHNVVECQYCQPIEPGALRRYWKHQPKQGFWHVIADSPNVLSYLPYRAHFLTVLSHTELADGIIGGYRGPLYFEFDSDTPSDTLEEVRTCLLSLHHEYNCPLEAIRVWHSGGRGFHVTIPAIVIGSDAGHDKLPQIYGALVDRLFPATMAPTLDRNVYSGGKGRMWRLPNRRRDNGGYKVPLAADEVLYRPYADLAALSRSTRREHFWPLEDELERCAGLAECYQRVVEACTNARSAVCPSVASVDMTIPNGRRNATLFRLGCIMRRYGFVAAAIEEALLAQNNAACEPPLEAAEVLAIAAQASRYQPVHGTFSEVSGDRPRYRVEVD